MIREREGGRETAQKGNRSRNRVKEKVQGHKKRNGSIKKEKIERERKKRKKERKLGRA